MRSFGVSPTPNVARRGVSASGRRLTAWLLIAGSLTLVPAQAADQKKPEKGPSVTRTAFGKTPDGVEASLFTCTNSKGASMQATDYGARIVAVNVPDRAGSLANVNLGFDSLEKYLAHTAFFGCTTGRFANRIARGRFSLDGKDYKLATNNGPNHLHGGTKGFDRYVWKATEIREAEASGVKFTLTSPDGDEGYPGKLETTVTMLWTDANELIIGYTAVTDKPTVLNLTNHAYWNLSGVGTGDILSHKLMINSDEFLPVDEGQIPTGKLASVKGTFMDFTSPQSIGSRIAETKFAALPVGYDHCFIIRKGSERLPLIARVEDPQSGRVMEVSTTEPAVQLYTSNFLDGDAKNGGFKQHSAFCLETQHYPDSPNRPEFPSVVLKPAQKLQSTTVYKFSTK
ncbi:MAG: galactose mutarotase [Planctomycetaceae bacterium]|nr:galactose mutarotase [Planctomycetaceae bacterium]